MTWKEIWKRLWFVLRSRLNRTPTCPECGWLMTRTEYTSPKYRWTCEACEELKRLEVEAVRQAQIAKDLEEEKRWKEREALRRKEMDRIVRQTEDMRWRTATAHATARIV